RDAALRTLERHAGEIGSNGDHLDKFIREEDRTGLDSRYIVATASPDYERAFAKMLSHGQMAHMHWKAREHVACSAVLEAQPARTIAERGMGISDPADGGFAVPVLPAPSVIPLNNASVSAVREYADVRTISTAHWKGVASTGMSASYEPELTEVV